MRVKVFAVSFWIAIFVPIVVYNGVSTFSPSQDWTDYKMKNYPQRMNEAITPEEKAKVREEYGQWDQKWREGKKRFQRNLFFIAIPIGIGAVIAGVLISVPAIGSGLIFGGIITLIEGTSYYWSQLEYLMKFLSAVIMLAMITFSGISTLIVGYLSYWIELEPWMKFLSAVIMLAVLVLIAYRKFNTIDKET